jgi:hypothetical protein
MHDSDVEREAERAIARWAVGEMDLATALHHACWALGQGRPGTCAVVRHDPAELLGAEPADPEAFFRVAALARGGSLEISEGLDAPVRWAACAPASGPDGDPRGALVVLGTEDATRAQTRRALPAVARICGAMLASEDSGRAAATVAHKMNNLLAATLANLAYAVSVAPPEGDLGRALQNTKESASLVATHANRLVRLATKGR